MRTPDFRLARAASLNAERCPGGGERDQLVARLQQLARRRKYAIKLQAKMDRALESYIRINFTDWEPDASEAERKKINAEVAALIKDARALNKQGKTEDGNLEVMAMVAMTDASRMPADDVRKKSTAEMEELAGQLPVAKWVEQVPGAGILGLALIVAEAGPLDRYTNPAKLWKRLGYAPYEGYAGSSWKRESWRPRKLTTDEWVEHPFSGERYAAMFNIATWLVNAQWISAKKAESDEGKPNGHYGEVYADRRAHTLVSHPDWSAGHRRADALRIAFKKFLVDLWETWIDQTYSETLGQRSVDAHARSAEITAAGQLIFDIQHKDARGGSQNPGQQLADAQKTGAGIAAAVSARGSKKNPGQSTSDAHPPPAGETAAGHGNSDAQKLAARGGTLSTREKNKNARIRPGS